MRTVGSANRAGLRLAPAAEVQHADAFPRSGYAAGCVGAAGGIAVVGVDLFPSADGPARGEPVDGGGPADGAAPDGEPSDGQAPRAHAGADDADAFDSDFFSLSPRDAGLLDPRQRVLLQCAWRALEDAAIAPRRRTASRTGVFVEANGGLAAPEEWAAAETGGGSVAQWISYQLGIDGPALDVRADDLTAPVALLLACDVLATGECDLVLVAGAGAEADDAGTPRAAVVALCRLDDALVDRRPVHAVLRYTADPADQSGTAAARAVAEAPEDVPPATGTPADGTPKVVTLAEAVLRLRTGPDSPHGLDQPWRPAALAPLVIDRPPAPLSLPASDAGVGVFTFSSDTAEGLRRNLLEQADAVTALAGHTPLTGSRARAARLCWTSNQVKSDLPHRFALSAADLGELADGLRRAVRDPGHEASLTGCARQDPAVAYVLPGEGSEYPGMTAALYRGAPLYRRALDEADEALRPYFGHRVRDLLLEHDSRVHRASFAQPALFAVEYALGRALSELGVEPGMVVGYGCGEFAAACLAGVLDLDTAARLVAVRGRLVEQLPPGGLLEVDTTLEETAALTGDEQDIYLAAVEGPRRVVLSAASEVLGRVTERLRLHGVESRPRQVGHAYHSPLLVPMLREWRQALEGAVFSPSLVPVVSTVRGRLLERERMDADYWMQHATAPVRFAEAVEALLAETPTHILELGPGARLVSRIRECPAARGVAARAVGDPTGTADAGLAELAAALYRDGHDLSWEALYPLEHRAFDRLRPYRFSDERRYGAPAPPGTVPDDDAVPRRLGAADPFLAAVTEAVARICDCLPGEVAPDARLYDDLGFDSVMYMDLVGELERRIPQAGRLVMQEMMPSLETVRTLAGYLRHRTGRVAA
jgi:acyl transferase domain-containing protein